MENFNKVLSFFLGLVVVIVFVIVLSNRLNLKDKFIPFQDAKTKVTPTVASEAEAKKNQALADASERLVVDRTPGEGATATPVPLTVVSPTQKPEAKGAASNAAGAVAPTGSPSTALRASKKPTNIPKTGSPTWLIPAIVAALFAGLKLRKTE